MIHSIHADCAGSIQQGSSDGGIDSAISGSAVPMLLALDTPIPSLMEVSGTGTDPPISARHAMYVPAIAAGTPYEIRMRGRILGA